MESISIIPLFENLGILALCALIHMRVYARETTFGTLYRQILLGTGFGLSAAMTMFAPIELFPGFIIDARAAPLLLSGPYGGILSAVIAAAIGGGTRLWIGGGGAIPGALGIVILGASSIVIWLWMRRRGQTQLTVLSSGIYCVFPLALSFSTVFFLIPNWDLIIVLLTEGFGYSLAGSLLGVMLLTNLLNWDGHRRQLQHDLMVSERQAREAVAAKDRFIASISHELRTPMNAVIGYLDLLATETSKPSQRSYIDRAKSGASSLARIIEELLNFSRIQVVGLELASEPTALRRELREAVESLRILAATKGLGFSDRIDNALPAAVSIDRTRLRQIISNVVGNAIKYTDAGSVFIDVSMKTSHNGPPVLSLLVKDTGIGMSTDTLHRLFDPFERGLGSIGREGTGLGMAITKSIVTAMGGEITVQSREDVGTSVGILIPIVEVAADEVIESEPASLAPTTVDSTARPYAILIAEDVSLNSELLEAALTRQGYTVVTAQNGEIALNKVKERLDAGLDPFDAIIMDVQMPVLDGIAATREIRALGGRHGASPIIGLSALAAVRDRKTCMAAGMTDYLSKPLSLSALYACVSRVVSDPSARPAPTEAPMDSSLSIDFGRLVVLNEALGHERTQSYIEETCDEIEEKLDNLLNKKTRQEEAAEILHDLISTSGLLGLQGMSREARAILNRLRSAEPIHDSTELRTSYAAWISALSRYRNDLSTLAVKAANAEHPATAVSTEAYSASAGTGVFPSSSETSGKESAKLPS